MLSARRMLSAKQNDIHAIRSALIYSMIWLYNFVSLELRVNCCQMLPNRLRLVGCLGFCERAWKNY